jgi:hypothetical protein
MWMIWKGRFLCVFLQQMWFCCIPQLEVVRTLVMELMDQLRPDAVSLVDAFEFPDNVLNSAIGRYDGNIYESLYKVMQGTAACLCMKPSIYRFRCCLRTGCKGFAAEHSRCQSQSESCFGATFGQGVPEGTCCYDALDPFLQTVI